MGRTPDSWNHSYKYHAWAQWGVKIFHLPTSPEIPLKKEIYIYNPHLQPTTHFPNSMFVGFPSATFGRNRLITVPPPTRANALSVPRTHSACGWAQFLHGLTGFNIILYINGAPYFAAFSHTWFMWKKSWMEPSQAKMFNKLLHIKLSLCNFYKQKRKAGFIQSMTSDPCQVTLNTQRGYLLSNYLFYNQYLIYLYSNNAIIIFKLFLHVPSTFSMERLLYAIYAGNGHFYISVLG